MSSSWFSDQMLRGLRLLPPPPPDVSNWSNSTDGAETLTMVHTTDRSHMPSLGVTLLICFTVLVNLFFFVPVYLSRRRRRRRAAMESAARAMASSMSTSSFRITTENQRKIRYNDIESWVASKTIVPHDHLCHKLQCYQVGPQARRAMYTKKRTETTETFVVGGADEEESSEGEEKELPLDSSSLDDVSDNGQDDSGKECPICFENFQPGDVASWSLDPSCNHVFHHVCIKQWLLCHKGCPFCRSTFMPIDETGMQLSNLSQGTPLSSSSLQQVSRLLEAHNERSKPTFYCEEHGIVNIPRCRPTCISTEEWQTISERGTLCPSRGELRELRATSDPGNDEKEIDDDNNEGEEPVDQEEGPSELSVPDDNPNAALPLHNNLDEASINEDMCVDDDDDAEPSKSLDIGTVDETETPSSNDEFVDVEHGETNGEGMESLDDSSPVIETIEHMHDVDDNSIDNETSNNSP